MINLQMIHEARQKVSEIINATPIFTASRLGDNIYIKMENLQKTGSFKIRGAYNKISNLTDEEKKKEVIACSAGNHAQGVALSATKQGIKSYICVPSVTPLSKIDATKGYGGEVIVVEGSFDDAMKRALELKEEHNYTFIHPFDDEYVIAGQGTIGLEILEQLEDIENIIVPIGGGGLISGIALAVKETNPKVKIIGVEPENAASMRDSIKANKRMLLDSVNTIAEGVAVKIPGEQTFALVKKYVDEIVTVSESEISNSILRLLEEGKTTAEGAGACSIAAAISDKYSFKGKTVCVLSGWNINVNMISKIIKTGLFGSGRLTEVVTTLVDKPGELVKILEIVKKCGANVLNINQYSESSHMQLNTMVVRIVLETFNETHQRAVWQALRDAGYEHFREAIY
ncbi:threonine ammonia-lyase [Treponema phagedenis F0421]|uniref:threonine ammonia-lyase n=1 Tax=Treponema phagedenis TaxID=162 RepID=UPI0001F641E0|nr:threonine ammonia-lyase [Treponema phagedenis]EFW39354.1 threonine ammonia-lyase [Treponema phagedenis F0421]